MREVRVVNRAGQRVAGFSAETFSRVAQGRYTSLPRGDLASSIFGKIENRLETIFDDSITRIEQFQDFVEVSFQNGPIREFDLVVGADGLHSKVRELVFGPENQFERYLGYKVAAFEAIGYRPKDELTYVMYTEVEQQVARFTMRDDRTMFLFIFKDESPGEANDDVAAQKALLRRRFGASGWECPQILNALDANCDLYFDRVSQIRMNPRRGSWGRGRVVLVGDAAFCVSLLAGQGSALAMVGAYILAGELYRAKGEYSVAFDRYQQLFHPFVWKKQQAALRFAGYFAPKSKFSLFLRNSVMNLMRIPWLADFVVGREISDRIPLPEYD
jgi:2-polyprenyl-6-methoxyphenol hydroxylase-like FAD-dependent oxidoreductase